MASNHTENYGLSQWEKTDKVVMEDFNEDNAKIDAAIKAAEGRVDDLAGTVSGLSPALSRKGNCQIYSTTYVGSGPYGASNPNRLTFPGKPLLVLITDGKTADFLALMPGGYGVNVGGNSYQTIATWGSNYVSWYNNQSALIQKNGSNYTYYVVAFLSVG